MFPENPVTLLVTFVDDGKKYNVTFPGNTLQIDDIGNGWGIVRSFIYNGNECFLHENNLHPNTTAEKIKNHLKHVLGDLSAAALGAEWGQGRGKQGTIIGALAGLTINEIVNHLPHQSHSEGYYNNKVKLFEGPIFVSLIL